MSLPQRGALAIALLMSGCDVVSMLRAKDGDLMGKCRPDATCNYPALICKPTLGGDYRCWARPEK